MSTHKKRKISARYLTLKETSYSFSFLEAIFNVERKFPAKKQNTKKIRKADRVTPISSSRRVDHNEVSPPSLPWHFLSLGFRIVFLSNLFRSLFSPVTGTERLVRLKSNTHKRIHTQGGGL
jgi:hypothetical protein